MASQENLDKTYLNMAETWASLSRAKRKQVGCLIVKDEVSSQMDTTGRLAGLIIIAKTYSLGLEEG